jgi:hypothetical protein
MRQFPNRRRQREQIADRADTAAAANAAMLWILRCRLNQFLDLLPIDDSGEDRESISV